MRAMGQRGRTEAERWSWEKATGLCTHTHTPTHTHTHTPHTHTHVHTHTHTPHTHTPHTHTHTHTHTYIRTHILSVCVLTEGHRSVCVRAHTHTRTHSFSERAVSGRRHVRFLFFPFFLFSFFSSSSAVLHNIQYQDADTCVLSCWIFISGAAQRLLNIAFFLFFFSLLSAVLRNLLLNIAFFFFYQRCCATCSIGRQSSATQRSRPRKTCLSSSSRCVTVECVLLL